MTSFATYLRRAVVKRVEGEHAQRERERERERARARGRERKRGREGVR
jgi:hypothetical protein